jgi:hypothetical protein
MSLYRAVMLSRASRVGSRSRERASCASSVTGSGCPSRKKFARPSLFSCNRDEMNYKQLRKKFRPYAGAPKGGGRAKGGS